MIFLALFIVCPLFGEGENLTIKVAVMGPGDELYFWWGHIALLVEDSDTDISYFYDYGLFSFDQENFFYNFAMGRMWYGCGVSYAQDNLAVYRYTNRDIVIYTLDLPPQTRAKVRDFARINVLPENSTYLYHHFNDNCSTRIRDIVDLATDGQFKELSVNTQSRFTLRQHVRRHTWFNPPVDWVLNFWMGQNIDKPITVWEDMFLPSEVGKRIDEFFYTDINGERKKLVSSVEVLNRAKNRPVVLDEPRKQWPYELTFSILLSLIFCFFLYLQTKKMRIAFLLSGFTLAVCGLVFGIASLLLYFMSIFTTHDYTYNNMNMIFCTPLLLASFPLGIRYAFTRNREKHITIEAWLRPLWLLTVIGIFVSMLLKQSSMFWQDNLTDELLLLPLALVFSLNPVGLKDVMQKYKKAVKKKLKNRRRKK
jgi:hypothetical protein